jgi:hypothetical protein
MKWDRRQYIDLVTFGASERPMFTELFGLLVGLSAQWTAQGATPEELRLDAFGFDYVETVDCGGFTGLRGGCAPRVLERTDDYLVEQDVFGRRTKLFFKSATLPLPLDHPVRDMDDWRRIRHWFTFDESRIDRDKLARALSAQRRGALVTADIPGGFDLPRQLLGEENLCYAYHDDPELVHDILETVGTMAFQVLDRISDVIVVDNLCIHEDMAGKSGSLIGPDLIREHLRPYYRRIWDMLSSKGARVFSQDSDGNMESVLDAFLECGVNVTLPAEPAAGMDMVELRRRYGKRLAFKGGIDKHVLRTDRASIRKELEYKLQLEMRSGTVFGLDHRITDGTPIENYRYYVQTAREILGLPPAVLDLDWKPMAF